MRSLGAKKLHDYRRPPGERKRSFESVGEAVGVSKVFVRLLEKGQRQPGRLVAVKMAQLGIAAPEDWDRPAPTNDGAA